MPQDGDRQQSSGVLVKEGRTRALVWDKTYR